MANHNKTAFINGKVYTVNPLLPLVNTVITEGNKITFTGDNSEAEKFIDEETRIIDLNGKLMLPGFIDSHVHFAAGGFYLKGINLREAKSVNEFRDTIKNYAGKNPGKWITGGSWDHENWDIKELPVKEMIDDLTPNTPVFVERLDLHMGLANTYALKLASITKDTPDPEGGLIIRNKNTGEPTGMLKDNAMALIYNIIPAYNDEEYLAAILAALDHAKKFGVTSIGDISKARDLSIYEKLGSENKLTCRIYSIYPLTDYKDLIKQNISVNDKESLITYGALKAFSDGSLGSSTAWFYDPYLQDPLSTGLPQEIILAEKLTHLSLAADSVGFQLCIHAIGDHANSYILDLYNEIIVKNPVRDRRFRIEHAQHLKLNDIKRFKKLNVIASVQPYHCIDDGPWVEKRIGKERVKGTYAFKSLMDAGVTLCFGTDWTVAPLNPLLGIYAAVTRRTFDGNNPDGWQPAEKIPVEDAIKCYTLNGAYAQFLDDIKGSIEPGKLADMVVLSDDILTIDPEKIKDTQVVMTIFNGEIISAKSYGE